MKSVYEFCFSIFSVNICLVKKKSVNFVILLLSQIIILAQNSQFFWYPGLPVKHWEVYYSFWNSINLLSVDVVVTAFGYIKEFIIFEVAMIGFVFFIILLILIMKIFNKTIPVLLKAIAKFFIILISEYFFIPTCILFFVIFKYSKESRDIVEEYPSELPGSSVNFGVYGQVLSVFVILFLIILTFIYETCSYDIRYPSEDFYENRKIHAKVDYVIKINYFINSYFFTSIQLTDYYTYLCIAFVLYSGTTGIMIYYIPYYSNVVNMIRLSTQLGCVLMCIFFWIGYTFNNSIITFVLTIFSIPILVFFSYSIVNYRVTKIPPISKSKRSSFEMFELSLRKTLNQSLNHSQLFNSMNKNFKSSKSRLIWVLQANFSLYYLNDSTLALNKISIPNYKGFNIPDCYQVFKCKQTMGVLCSQDSFGFKVLDFFKKFQDVKSKDHEFCRNYLSFLNDFSEKTISLQKLKQSIRRLVLSMQVVNHSYQNIHNLFPAAFQVKKFFGSLMNGLLNNSKKGKKLLNEADSLKNLSQTSKKSEMSYGKGNFIIAADKANFGKLIFCNEEFLDLLKFEKNLTNDLHLSLFLPENIYKSVKKHLLGFLKTSTSSVVVKDCKMFFLDKNGYLQEFYTKIENISNEETSFFWFVLDSASDQSREFVLLSDFGVVLEQSQYFNAMLTSEPSVSKGTLVSSFIQEFSLEPNLSDEFIPLPESQGRGKAEFYLLSKQSLFNESFFVLYLFNEVQLDSASNVAKIPSEKILMFRTKTSKTSTVTKKFQLTNFENSSDEDESKTRKDLRKVSRKSVFVSSEIILPTHNNLRKSDEIKSSIFSFKIAKYLTSVSVFLLVCIFIGIITNIYIETNERTNISTLDSMQDALFSLEKLVFLIRSVDISYSNNLDFKFNLTDIENELKQLSSIQVKLKKGEKNLKDCRAYSHVYEGTLMYWTLTEDLSQKSLNVISIVDSLIMTTEKILAKLRSKENHKFLMVELIYSLYFSLNSHLLHTSSEFISCEHEKLKNCSTRQTILFYTGTGLSVLAFILTCLFTLMNRKNVNLLWELLRFQVKSSSRLVRAAVVERLQEYHFDSDTAAEDEESEGQGIRKIIDRFFSYILNFSLICLISISIYLIVNFYFFPEIVTVLSSYSQLMMKLEHLKSFTMTMNFFTIESFLEKQNKSISVLFRNSYILQPSAQILNKTYENLHENHKTLETATRFLFVDEKFDKLVHGKNKLKLASARLGLIPSQDYLITESYFLSSNCSQDDLELNKFYSDIEVSIEMISELKESCKASATKLLSSMKQNLLIFSLFSVGLLILFTNQLYIKSLNKEVEVIHSIVSLIELFPTSPLRQQRFNKI